MYTSEQIYVFIYMLIIASSRSYMVLIGCCWYICGIDKHSLKTNYLWFIIRHRENLKIESFYRHLLKYNVYSYVLF